jgi:hypothetical protein
MQLHARLMGRIASLGLGLVFVALIMCTLWATARIQRAADHASAAVSLSDLYSSANRGLDTEASLERRHMNDVNSGSWRDVLDAVRDTNESLTAIAHSQYADDRQVAQSTLKLHDSYIDTLRELYRAVDLGSMQYAATVDHEEADPQFAAVQNSIASRATRATPC